MKKLLIILAFSSIYFIFGCTETGQVAGPENSIDEVSGEKIIGKKSIPLSELKLLTMPAKTNSLSKKHVVEKFAKIEKSSSIRLDEWYDGGIHGEVEIYAKIRFDKKSIMWDYSFYDDVEYEFDDKGKKVKITMEVDDKSCIVTFTPHLMFNKPAKLELEFKGLDFTGYTEDDLKLVYIPEGDLEAYYPNVDRVKINLDKGEFKAYGLEIEHFSRYAITAN